MKKRSGNSMIEYVLPVGIVTLGAGVLISLTDLPSQISGMMTGTMNGQQKGETLEVNALGELERQYSGEKSQGRAASGAVSGASLAYISPNQFYGNTQDAFKWRGEAPVSDLAFSMPTGVDTQGAIGAANTSQAYGQSLESLARGVKSSNPEASQGISIVADQVIDLASQQKTYIEACAAGACSTAQAEKIQTSLGGLEMAFGQIQSLSETLPEKQQKALKILKGEILTTGQNMFSSQKDGSKTLNLYMEYGYMDAKALEECLSTDSCSSPNQRISHYIKMGQEFGKNDRQLMEQKYGVETYKEYREFTANQEKMRKKHALSDGLQEKFNSKRKTMNPDKKGETN